MPRPGAAFDVEFLGDAVLHQRRGFPAGEIDQKLFGHGGFLKWGMGKGRRSPPAYRSSRRACAHPRSQQRVVELLQQVRRFKQRQAQ